MAEQDAEEDAEEDPEPEMPSVEVEDPETGLLDALVDSRRADADVSTIIVEDPPGVS